MNRKEIINIIANELIFIKTSRYFEWERYQKEAENILNLCSGYYDYCELIDFDVEWALARPARLSFKAKLSNGYIMEGNNLQGNIIIKEDK